MVPYRKNVSRNEFPQNIPDFIPDSGFAELISALAGSTPHIPAFQSSHELHVCEQLCESLSQR